MYNSPTSKKPRPATSYLVRPRLGPLRNIFSSKPMSSYNPDKKKKTKKYSGAKMEYRRRPDYADTAYREAVGRLRILLAESYTPIKRPLRELDSAGEDTDNQSIISGTSRASKIATRPYYHYLSMVPKRYYYPPIRPSSTVPTEAEKSLSNPQKFENNSAPPELMSFIEKQEEYIEQLEKESRFCREELSSLLSKVKDVISENENLHEKQKCNIMKSVFHHLETETETETDVDLAQQMSRSPKKSKVLEGPMIVFESRISELEAHLTQAKIDLRKALEDNENYKKKISDGSILDGLGFDNYKKQIESLQREKDVLQETVTKLQSALSKIKDKENDTCDQVKRSLDAVEQAHYEKNAAENEIRRLKDELERQHAKLRDAISDQSRRISDERSAVERRYTQQIEQLTSELGVQWETTNKLQLELDKQRRENADLRRELTQKQAMLDGMKKDMQNKIMTLQSDIGVNGAEKGALEQQIATLQMTNERNERQSKQEVARLQAEMQSLRQRLDRADADLIHSRRENIRLNEQVASLEKEIKLNSAVNEEKGKSSGEILALPAPQDQDKQISSLIQNMESKHATTVTELEGMIHSQNQLMDKLSLECHTLTQKLEDASARHKEEIRELQTNLNRLNSTLLNQTQITPSSVKDEAYNPVSHKRPAPPDSTKYEQNQPRDLSRTNSRSSVQQDNVPKKYEEKTPSFHQSPKQELKDPQLVKNLEKPSNFSDIDTARTASTKEEYDQQYVDPNNQNYPQSGEMYQTDLNPYENESQYINDPNQQYEEYAADPNLQYVTDSNQEYSTDPNQQYITDPNQQYVTDPNLQYATDPNQEYVVDPNQQYSAESPQEYVMEHDQQKYAEEPNYASDSQQSYKSNPNQQYAADPAASSNQPDRQYQY